MNQPVAINRQIIESLYSEALVLSDEVRNAFDLSAPGDRETARAAAARAELSSEALRTTTRMMHALAWLLNQRAFLAGELSELQLRRYGKLPPERQPNRAETWVAVTPEIRRLIEETQKFYARLQRLDREWRERDPQPPVAALRSRLGNALTR
jgi:regulator of CtrA degradation